MQLGQRLSYVVREAARLQPGRPALRMGLRASLAVTAPILVASQIGALVTTWATLGGFAVVLVDKGGAYRTRAKAMLSAALGGAIAVLAGSLAADSSAVLAVTAIGCGVCAMAATWPGPAVAVANTMSWQLIVATTFPHDPRRWWVPALGFVAGGAWSIVLALLLWPVRVYRPARLAASRCLAAVAQQANLIATRSAGPASWRELYARRHRVIRETLEAARGVLAATRRGRRGEIGRGERLLVIVESVDQIFGVLIAVEEVVDNLGLEASAAIDGELRAALAAIAGRLDEISERVVVEAELPELPPLGWTADAARAVAGTLPPLARTEADHALSLIGRMLDDVAAVAAVVDSLTDERDPLLAPRPTTGAGQHDSSAVRRSGVSGLIARLAGTSGPMMRITASGAFAPIATTSGVRPPMSDGSDGSAGSGGSGGGASVAASAPGRAGEPGGSAALAAPRPPGVLDALRGSLDLDSAVLRHALRVAAVALLSVIATRALDLQRGYWATLTAVLLLQPYLPATITRGVQRVAGTIAGGILATAIAAVVHDPRGIGIASIVFAGVSAAVIQLNYGLYALFLTPTFVLLAEVHARDTHLVALRISNTLLGAGLAVAGALLLWPSRESTRTGDRLASAFDAAADYAREVFAAVVTRAPSPARSVIAARRRSGRALNNAELSLDRLAAEGPPPAILESYMTLGTMTRRLSATLSAFVTARHVASPGETSGADDADDAVLLTTIGNDAEAYLRAAARSLRDGTPAPGYARHDGAGEALPALLATRVTRIDRQLAILSEAVARVHSSTAPA